MKNGMLVRRVRPAAYVRGELDRVFDDVFGGFVPGLRTSGAGWLPSLDVSESEDEITVQAEIPGVNPEAFDISVIDDVLSISGEKADENEEQGENFHRKERRFGSFRRSIALPDTVDTENITAEYDRGVLTIRLAKIEKVLPKKIRVNEKN
jgi:HSP20 family protein